MPGVAELQSLATMEAMAAGRPVVAADAVALPHLVVPGRNGWLYPPGDVPALAGRLAALFGQPGALSEMGAVSRELIARHDVRASLDTFENLYRHAIGTGEHLPVAAGKPVQETFADIAVPMVSIPAGAVRP
jgi:glycosyltransferase involved in cell wall biosynthesis